MKLHLENINTKVGKLVDQSIELGEGNDKVTAIFESPTTMVTVADIDAEEEVVQNTTPLYNTLIVSGLQPFIVFSVHYDRRYITRKFRSFR